MKKSTLLALLLGAICPAWFQTANAGGEDFPFFCRMGGDREGEAFRVVNDNRWSSGYAIELYRRGRMYAYVGAWVGDSNDNKHWTIFARERIGLFRDRQFLGYIAKARDAESGADVQMTLTGMDTTFYLNPVNCGSM